MNSSIAVLVAICVLSLAAAYKLVPANKYKILFILLAFTAVIVRIATVIILYRAGTDTFGTDGLLYHKAGIWVKDQLAEGVPFFSVRYAYTWYTALVGLVYHIFGVNRYIVSYINIAFAFFSAILLLKIALNLKYRFVNAAFISLIFLYFPNLFLWTADSRKEALLIFVSFLCLYCTQRFFLLSESGTLSTASGLVRIAFICLLVWFCTLVRIYMFVPLAFGILICIFLSYLKNHKRLYIMFCIAIIVCSFITFFATVYPLLDNYHAVMFPDEIGNLGEDIGNKLETVKLLASGRNILSAAANYILLPYPGKVDIADIRGNDTLNAIVGIDMTVWYLCLLLMLTGLYSLIRKRSIFLTGTFAYLIAYVSINVLVVENVADTIYRYRSVIVGISLLFIDFGVFSHIRSRITDILSLGDGNAKPGIISSCSIKSNF